ncbi:uncharacterized protein LOC120126943 [Hibiscus syriacus]|uniref:uncharacterized protein LOC120126943 n=1 Tax=Hibiscus syriacus TaxID=106335 RepID=UPI001921723D|nr:uncharacterized protein LOC120126943 [Hibiscus syriacus]
MIPSSDKQILGKHSQLSCQSDIPSFFCNSQCVLKSVAKLCDSNDTSVESEPEETLAALKTKLKQKSKSDGKKKGDADQALALRTEEPMKKEKEGSGKEAESGIEAKILAIHRVRWNVNKGSDRWLCYGGAAGIVRYQEINIPASSTLKVEVEAEVKVKLSRA